MYLCINVKHCLTTTNLTTTIIERNLLLFMIFCHFIRCLEHLGRLEKTFQFTKYALVLNHIKMFNMNLSKPNCHIKQLKKLQLYTKPRNLYKMENYVILSFTK